MVIHFWHYCCCQGRQPSLSVLSVFISASDPQVDVFHVPIQHEMRTLWTNGSEPSRVRGKRSHLDSASTNFPLCLKKWLQNGKAKKYVFGFFNICSLNSPEQYTALTVDLKEKMSYIQHIKSSWYIIKD